MELVPRLLDKVHELGFRIRGGSLFRDPRLHGQKGHPDVMTWLETNFPEAFTAAEAAGYRGYGSRVSLHKDKCAIDLNLFLDGQPVTGTDEHAPIGAWWEEQNPLCRWGGRFNDGNHYEYLAEPWR